ncbi:MAG: DUF5060 domain-containing protein, partial [Kiloniellales bacterium]|nr:DUF5060 domain-containing protein [Kiloniellales bacterium]
MTGIKRHTLCGMTHYLSDSFRLFLVLGLLIFLGGCSQSSRAEGVPGAGQSEAVLVSGQLVKWHPVTISFAGPNLREDGESPNPFMDYRLQVALVSPSGEKLTVPGFFDGDGQGGGQGNVWRIRFAPHEEGTWRFEASFREGTDIAVSLEGDAGERSWFDGEAGEFRVAGRDPDAKGFMRWGRLNYVNGHYLKFADGPFWIKGGVDSPENFLGFKGFDNTFNQGGKGILHEYAEHRRDWREGDPIFVSSDHGVDGKGIIGALNYLSEEAVNSIYFLPMNLGGDGQDTYPFLAPENTVFNKLHYDISKLHQWDLVLNHAQEVGIALNIVLAETEEANETWLDGGVLGRERKLFYRELIARFSYLLALKWNLSEETSYPPDSRRAFAGYIRALDWANHPVTFHTPVDRISIYDTHLGEPLFHATSVQYGLERSSIFVETLRSATAGAERPLVVDMDENNPGENALTDRNAKRLRKEALYPIYFSGGSVEWFFGSNRLPPGGDQSTEDFRTREEMYRYMRYAREFLETHTPFWDMEPADGLLDGETEVGGRRGQVFHRKGEVYAVYLPD